MTVQRRHRLRSPTPGRQDRLRALALDASPVARRLRARIPRPPLDPVPSSEGVPPLPSAPYAAAAVRSAYRPGGGAFSSGPGGHPSSGPVAGGRSRGAGSGSGGGSTDPRAHGPRPVPSGRGSGAGPSLTGARPERDPDDLTGVPPPAVTAARRFPGSVRRSAGGEGPEGPGADPWRDPSEEAPGRPTRPPSGYTEFGPPDSVLERLARRWSVGAALSRRAVLALIVLGASAVVLVVVLHDRPSTVPTPEMVVQAAPADHPPGSGSGGVADPRPEEAPPAADTAEVSEVVVHVGGEVEAPGLYTLPPGSRVADAVEEAGGALPEADLDVLNLARPLVDGEQVLVGVPPPVGVPEAAPPGVGGPVNINQADRALLETLPGVGPVIADNIIAHREEHGPFGSVDELLDVNRIGEKMLATLRPHVTVG